MSRGKDNQHSSIYALFSPLAWVWRRYPGPAVGASYLSKHAQLDVDQVRYLVMALCRLCYCCPGTFQQRRQHVTSLHPVAV